MPSIFVLDSSALINNSAFSFEGKKCAMTNLCLLELKEWSVREKAEFAIRAKELEIVDPCPNWTAKVLKVAEKIGDSKLSAADISCLALAAEWKEKGKNVRLVSDDFSVQNMAKHLKIPFVSVSKPGIKRKRVFKRKTL
ncbi:MAG: hypothetical protein V1847_00015 [Candidatus Diapherotrites archaeon]